MARIVSWLPRTRGAAAAFLILRIWRLRLEILLGMEADVLGRGPLALLLRLEVEDGRLGW